jgi:hypothetical protein
MRPSESRIVRLHNKVAVLLRLFLSILTLKFLVPLFVIPKQTLSQLSNFTLRQSEDAAFTDPTDNAIPKSQASIIDKILFIILYEKENKNYFSNTILYNELDIKVKSFLKCQHYFYILGYDLGIT